MFLSSWLKGAKGAGQPKHIYKRVFIYVAATGVLLAPVPHGWDTARYGEAVTLPECARGSRGGERVCAEQPCNRSGLGRQN